MMFTPELMCSHLAKKYYELEISDMDPSGVLG